MLKNRLELAKHFASLGFTKGAEVGTAFGVYAEKLCKIIPGLQLTIVDNWDNPESHRRAQKQHRDPETVARNVLAPYNVTVVKKSSMDGLADVPDESLDFVFIDANHKYEAVKEDIREWSKKVRKGGIVSGHDYYIFPNSGNRGVVDAVDEFCKENNIKLQTTEWDNDNPERDDRQPCWYYIKE